MTVERRSEKNTKASTSPTDIKRNDDVKRRTLTHRIGQWALRIKEKHSLCSSLSNFPDGFATLFAFRNFYSIHDPRKNTPRILFFSFALVRLVMMMLPLWAFKKRINHRDIVYVLISGKSDSSDDVIRRRSNEHRLEMKERKNETTSLEWDAMEKSERKKWKEEKLCQAIPYGNPNLCIRFMSMAANPICCASSMWVRGWASGGVEYFLSLFNLETSHKFYSGRSTFCILFFCATRERKAQQKR